MPLGGQWLTPRLHSKIDDLNEKVFSGDKKAEEATAAANAKGADAAKKMDQANAALNAKNAELAKKGEEAGQKGEALKNAQNEAAKKDGALAAAKARVMRRRRLPALR